MARHATSTSFKKGINPKTGGPAMTPEEVAARRIVYYHRHKAKIEFSTWKRQIKALGCTPEQYVEMLQKQHDVCAICKSKNKTKRQLAVDHDHKTGKIRGLLCQRCNLVLGQLKESIALLKKMEKYLCRPKTCSTSSNMELFDLAVNAGQKFGPVNRQLQSC